MKKAVLYGFMAAMTLALTVACGQKNEDSKADVGGRQADRVAGTTQFPNAPYNRTSAMVSSGQLDAMTKAFLSSSMEINQNNIGQVTSVNIQGDVAVDSNSGNLLQGRGAILLTIQDTLVGQNQGDGQIQPIEIYIPATAGGASGGVVQLTFSDSYGTVTIRGNYNQSTMTGTIEFTNSQGNGYNGVRSGTLGTFSMPVCSFFRCSNY